MAKGELMYGRDICKNPEGYTWNKTYYYQFRWNLLLIYNHLSIPMKFVICLQSFINSDGIYNLFAISY